MAFLILLLFMKMVTIIIRGFSVFSMICLSYEQTTDRWVPNWIVIALDEQPIVYGTTFSTGWVIQVIGPQYRLSQAAVLEACWVAEWSCWSWFILRLIVTTWIVRYQSWIIADLDGILVAVIIYSSPCYMIVMSTMELRIAPWDQPTLTCYCITV